MQCSCHILFLCSVFEVLNFFPHQNPNDPASNNVNSRMVLNSSLDLVSLEQIEAIMNDFIQLAPQSNVYDAETMVEG